MPAGSELVISSMTLVFLGRAGGEGRGSDATGESTVRISVSVECDGLSDVCSPRAAFISSMSTRWSGWEWVNGKFDMPSTFKYSTLVGRTSKPFHYMMPDCQPTVCSPFLFQAIEAAVEE
jgi:hypothetical protein